MTTVKRWDAFVTPDFRQMEWDELTADDCRQIIRLAVREDLGRGIDLTTAAIVPYESRGAADVVFRRPGILSGILATQLVIDEMELDVELLSDLKDGAAVEPATRVARLRGSTRDLLTAERIMLNLIGRLAGIATLTRRYVDAVHGAAARIYDTRKTTPGWRRLEKYAVRCGGGHNHRTGLFDAVLIKDNHLAQAARSTGALLSPSAAVKQAREFLDQFYLNQDSSKVPVEVEVDSLEQLADVLPAEPDIVLLDNMSVEQVRQAVRMRNEAATNCELEASGGVTLETIRTIAETGVDRISIGALTHSASSLDVALDWQTKGES